MKTRSFKSSLYKLFAVVAMMALASTLFATERTQIHVKVTDEQNQPIFGVMASLRSLKSASVIQSISCDSAGSVVLEKVKRGKYMILINNSDLSNAIVASFEITKVEATPVEITVKFHKRLPQQNLLSLVGAVSIDSSLSSEL